MKQKRDWSRKCAKYIEKNDFPRFKSYLRKRKHRLDVNELKLDGDNTLLHAACRLGHAAIVGYLLKKGADCKLLNACGDLPIHLAVKFALSGHKYAYTDLVLPLIKKAPDSLDVPNAAGNTCRQLLQQYKYTVNCDIEDSDTETSQSEDEVSDTDWNRRLFEEMTGEHDEHGDAHEQAYYESHEDSESWDQWAERIYHQHRGTTQSIYHPTATNPSKSHKRKSKLQDASAKRPKISEEKKKAFERNMKLEHQRQSEELAEVRNMIHQKSLQIYETMCTYLFGGVPKREVRQQILSEASKERLKILRQKFCILEDKSVLLEHNDVPWPVKADTQFKYRWNICEDLIVEFLFRDMKVGSVSYTQRLKTEQRRWHPDRFMQKCGHRLKETDRDKIIETVTTISQVLNKLSQDRKK